MPLKMDTSKSGLGMFMKDYQELAFRYLWSLSGEGASSHDVWVNVNKELGAKRIGRTSISRAAIIIFLDAMVEDGLLACTEETGKGGYRRIYRVKYDENDLKEHVAGVVIRSLLRNFSEETRRAMGEG